MKKKAKKAARSIKPIGRSPVISVRVPAVLHAAIVKSAKDSNRSLSEEMASRLQRSFEWDLALQAGLLDRGFQLQHGAVRWVRASDLATAAAGIGTPEFNVLPTAEKQVSAVTEEDEQV